MLRAVFLCLLLYGFYLHGFVEPLLVTLIVCLLKSDE